MGFGACSLFRPGVPPKKEEPRHRRLPFWAEHRKQMVASATGFWAGSISRQSEKRFPETAKSKKNGGRRINAGLSRLIMKKLTDLEYLRLNTFQRLWYNIVLFVLGIPGWLASLVKAVGNGIAGAFRGIRNEPTDCVTTFTRGSWKTKVSYLCLL